MPSDDKKSPIMARWALRHPYDLKKVEEKATDLLNAPLVTQKKLCATRDCEHTLPTICLFNTLASLVVEQIKAGLSLKHPDKVSLWRGCVYLWLTEVHPLEPVVHYAPHSQRGKTIDIKFVWNSEHYPADTADAFQEALHALETALLKHPLSPPITKWPNSRGTVNADIQTARLWLAQEVLASARDKAFLREMRLALEARYNHFRSPPLPNIASSGLTSWRHWPQLRLGKEIIRFQDFVEQLAGRNHIFGVPGSGKTEMSRYITGWTAEKEPPAFFPLFFDARLMGINRPADKDTLLSLSINQWCPDKETGRNWLKTLQHNAVPFLPIIDNWDCLRAEYASLNRESYLQYQLRQYPQFLIFSRQKYLNLDLNNIRSYEIYELDTEDIKGILAEWRARGNLKDEMNALQTLVLSASAPNFIRREARALQGLLSLCYYTARNGSPPASEAGYLRHILEWLLSRETERLSAPPSTIVDLPGVLQELAWQAFINENGAPRQSPAPGVPVSKTRHLFQKASQKEIFNNLLDSWFLIIKTIYGRQYIQFYNPLHRDFYAARKLLTMENAGDRIALQMSGEAGWRNMLQYRIQLLNEETE